MIARLKSAGNCYGSTDMTVRWDGEVVTSSTYSPPVVIKRPYRCAGSRQPNNYAMLVHWGHSKQQRVIRDHRKYVAITMPRRLQRGRNR